MIPKYICPHCKTTQSGVIEVRTQEIFLSVWPESKGNYSYEHDNDGDIKESFFTCPSCAEKLAASEQELDNLFFNN